MGKTRYRRSLEHLFRFPRESRIRHILNEPQEQEVFEPLAYAPQIFLDERTGS